MANADIIRHVLARADESEEAAKWSFQPNSVPFPGSREYNLIAKASTGQRLVIEFKVGSGNVHFSELAQVASLADELDDRMPGTSATPVLITNQDLTPGISNAALSVGVKIVRAPGEPDSLSEALISLLRQTLDSEAIRYGKGPIRTLMTGDEFREAATRSVDLVSPSPELTGLHDHYIARRRPHNSKPQYFLLDIRPMLSSGSLAMTLGDASREEDRSSEIALQVISRGTGEVVGGGALSGNGEGSIEIGPVEGDADLILQWEEIPDAH